MNRDDADREYEINERKRPHEYLVLWLIDEDAAGPGEAAQLAHRHQQPPSEATVFDVYDKMTGDAWHVDVGHEPILVNPHDPDTCRAIGHLLATL